MESEEDKTADADADEETITEILFRLGSSISNAKISKFNVSRSHIWESARRGFSKSSFFPTQKVSVMFTDDDGVSEGAIDLGGPTREFFTLVLNEMVKGNLFEGNKQESQVLTCFSTYLNNGD